MELQFLARAMERPELRGPQRRHCACALGGLAAFSLEDCVCGKVPLLHSAWHCLSAACLHSTNVLLKDVEERQQQEQQRRRQAGPQKPLCMEHVVTPLHLRV